MLGADRFRTEPSLRRIDFGRNELEGRNNPNEIWFEDIEDRVDLRRKWKLKAEQMWGSWFDLLCHVHVSARCTILLGNVGDSLEWASEDALGTHMILQGRKGGNSPLRRVMANDAEFFYKGGSIEKIVIFKFLPFGRPLPPSLSPCSVLPKLISGHNGRAFNPNYPN